MVSNIIDVKVLFTDRKEFLLSNLFNNGTHNVIVVLAIGLVGSCLVLIQNHFVIGHGMKDLAKGL